MKKIWIGGLNACDVHQQIRMLNTYLKISSYEIVEELKNADLVIVPYTCVGTYQTFLASFQCIEEILSIVDSNIPIIVSGCLANGVKFALTEEQKELLSKVTCVKEKDLINYISKLLNKGIIDKLANDIINDIPYYFDDYSVSVNPVFGCLNKCSFCKSNYANFTLRSEPFEKIESFAKELEKIDMPFYHLQMFSSNLSLYGIDLYQKQRTHEIIKILTNPEKIKFVHIGSLINWYKELVDEIIINPKIKTIFTSLESGSPRIYELMNRPISLENLIKIIKFIKKERPDIIIDTEVIAGYPTETIDDLKRTADLISELDIYPNFVWNFENSEQIPASKLPQHSEAYCREAHLYLVEHLEKLHKRFENEIENRELIVLKKYEDEHIYLVMTIEGNYRYVRFDQLDKQYEEGELILPNSVVPKQIIRKRKKDNLV